MLNRRETLRQWMWKTPGGVQDRLIINNQVPVLSVALVRTFRDCLALPKEVDAHISERKVVPHRIACLEQQFGAVRLGNELAALADDDMS